MKILITHAFAPCTGGSYLYTQEVTSALRYNHNVVVVNENIINHNFPHEINTIEQITKEDFDLIIIMQAKHFIDLKIPFKQANIINIIHSEVYDIDHPLLFNNIKYVAVREEILKYLINNFNIDKNLILTILNPINKDFYNKISDLQDDFVKNKFGIFACGILTQIRLNAAIEFSHYCRENKIKSLFVGNIYDEAKQNLYQFYDKILDATPNVNYYMNHATICGGIQKGRTYWEAKLLSKPVMEYMVDSNGEIINEIYEKSPTQQELEIIKKITDPEYVTNQIIQWAFN